MEESLDVVSWPFACQENVVLRMDFVFSHVCIYRESSLKDKRALEITKVTVHLMAAAVHLVGY